MTLITYPEVFTNKKFQYGKTEKDKHLACADGLMGWGNCHIQTPPEDFGTGMVKISQLLGISASPEALMEYADQIPKVTGA